jgi:signal transduction histidine kinase
MSSGLAGLVLEITLLAWILRRQVAVPLKALDAATQAVAQGNMSVSIEPRGHAELGLLADRFLGMLERLRERDASLVRSEASKDALLQQLEDRVASRTIALEQSNAELQTAMKVLRTAQDELLQREKLASLGRMVAGLAHELNTPIGNALTIGTAMADHARILNDKFLGDELKKSTLATYLNENVAACAVLERALAHAAELIANFKQVSADRLSERRRNFDLAHTVEEVLATLRPSFRTTQFQLLCRVGPDIRMDSYPGLLTQVISNLVINAKLHAFENRERGVVVIEGECAGGNVTMTVSDDGQGIEPNIRSRIFDPFFTTRMGRGGTGLGLSFVHALVANGLGGNIHMEPGSLQGTRFVMTFPLVAPQQPSGLPE